MLTPEALIDVRDELMRIREGRGTDLELEEDDAVWAVVDNAQRLATKLAEARPGLGRARTTELDLFTG